MSEENAQGGQTRPPRPWIPDLNTASYAPWPAARRTL